MLGAVRNFDNPYVRYNCTIDFESSANICSLFLILLFTKFTASSVIDETQKSPETLESIFLAQEDDSSYTRCLWRPLMSALKHSPYRFLLFDYCSSFKVHNQQDD